MSAEDGVERSPWITVWFSPRRTIERLVSNRPIYFVWPLAVFGTIASIYSQMSVIGSAGLFDWQLGLCLMLFGAVAGLIWLYLAGLVLSWIGRMLGGQAPALHLRAAFAWSMLPTIAGTALILLIDAVTHRGNALDSVPLLVAVSSLWSLVIFLLMLGRVEGFGVLRTILTWLLNLILGLVVALFIRSLLYQPFNIPSGSMRPTLLVGDYVFVSKYAYGYGRHSLPYASPMASGRIFSAEPARGDVVVFRVTKDRVDYVKRVVGLPGDRIQMKNGELFINGVPVKRERLADADEQEACNIRAQGHAKHWRETLPSGVSYETLDCLENSILDNTGIYTVPDGHFFALGDNRDNSTDSRMPSVGYIPFDDLIGRAGLIFFSRDDGSPPHVRFSRLGMLVR